MRGASAFGDARAEEAMNLVDERAGDDRDASLALARPPPSPARHEHERAGAYERASLGERTLHEYARDWRDFCAWCDARGIAALPAAPQTVGSYLAGLADRGLAVMTIQRRAVAIARAHRARGHASPRDDAHVRNVLAGVARTRGTAQRKKDALDVPALRVILEVCDDSLQGVRNRALILVTFAAALRRSEAAALDVDDLRFEERGVVVTVRRSKSDQMAAGCAIAIPRVAAPELCPVRALRAWIDAAAIADGPLFRSFGRRRGRVAGEMQARRIDGRDVARILQRATADAGLDGNFGAHSLRAGFVTAGAVAGVADRDLMRVTRHRSVATLHGYIRRATVFEDPPLATILGGTAPILRREETG